MNANCFIIKNIPTNIDSRYVYEEAAANLNGGALKLFIYFNFKPKLEEFAFSPREFAKKYNVSPTGARNAFQELARIGYLSEVHTGEYEFKNFVKI